MALTLIPSDLIEQAARADRRHCSRILHQVFEQSLQVKEIQRTVTGLIAYDAVSPAHPSERRPLTPHKRSTRRSQIPARDLCRLSARRRHAEAVCCRTGGVLSFVFADLIILPILDIYRRDYGWKMAGFLLASFYVTMVTTGLAEFFFQGLGIGRHARNAKVVIASLSWNYTAFLNIVFLLLAAVLVWRYFRRGGGWAMLRLMNRPIGETHHAPARRRTAECARTAHRRGQAAGLFGLREHHVAG
jgi:hypothetical protein